MKNENELVDLVEDLVGLGLDDIIELDLRKTYHFTVIDRLLTVARRYKTEDGGRITKIANLVTDAETRVDGISANYIVITLVKRGVKYNLLFSPYSNFDADKPYPQYPKWSIRLSVHENQIPDTIIYLDEDKLHKLWMCKPGHFSIPERYLWILERLKINLDSGSWDETTINYTMKDRWKN